MKTNIFLKKESNQNRGKPKTTGIYKAKWQTADFLTKGEKGGVLSFQLCLDEQAKRTEKKIADFRRIGFNRALISSVNFAYFSNFGGTDYRETRGGTKPRKTRIIEGKRKQTAYLKATTANKLFTLAWKRKISVSKAAKLALLWYWARLAKKAAAYHMRTKAKGLKLSLRAYLKAGLNLRGTERNKPTKELIEAMLTKPPKPAAA